MSEANSENVGLELTVALIARRFAPCPVSPAAIKLCHLLNNDQSPVRVDVFALVEQLPHIRNISHHSRNEPVHDC